ncbi:MAG: radical SAM protein [Oscillospiraceae bacterium]|nr:radical SAM protein [Oscillospiraceae bacterium]
MHYVKAKGILSQDNGMNLYRGCTHGCIYCDSRSRCYQINHIFEDIEVKENALALLEKALKAKRKRCMIGTGAMTDPYLPLEERLELTRGALELIYQYGFGAAVQTKSDRCLRDLELLAKINERSKAVLQMTLTTHGDGLCRILEPNVSPTSRRVAALKQFRDAGVPTVVWLSPILPYINDTRENIEGLLESCIEAGVKGILCFNMGLTLREGSREYFYTQLDMHFPGLKCQYIREFGNDYEINSPKNTELMQLFHETCEKAGIMHDVRQIFQYLHEFEEKEEHMQMSLFD